MLRSQDQDPHTTSLALLLITPQMNDHTLFISLFLSPSLLLYLPLSFSPLLSPPLTDQHAVSGRQGVVSAR